MKSIQGFTAYIDSNKLYRNIFKTNPVSFFLESNFTFERLISKKTYLAFKGGYRKQIEKCESNSDWSSYDLFKYFNGPIGGIGIRHKLSKDKLTNYQLTKNQQNFIEFDLIGKFLYTNRANVSRDIGERNTYESYGGHKNIYAIKVLIVQQRWYKNFFFEWYIGGGLKLIDNRKFINLGDADIGDKGGIIYGGYEDYESIPEGAKKKTLNNTIFPTINFGINIGFGLGSYWHY